MENDDFCVALYGKHASIDPHVEAYTPDGEVAGQGYAAGGQQLRGIVVGVTGSTAWMTWTEPVRWENATIHATHAMIYNRTKNNLALAVLSLGGEVVSTNGPWLLEFPAPGATAVIRWS